MQRAAVLISITRWTALCVTAFGPREHKEKQNWYICISIKYICTYMYVCIYIYACVCIYICILYTRKLKLIKITQQGKELEFKQSQSDSNTLPSTKLWFYSWRTTHIRTIIADNEVENQGQYRLLYMKIQIQKGRFWFKNLHSVLSNPSFWDLNNDR